MHTSVALITFTTCCNHSYYLFLKLFHPPKQQLYNHLVITPTSPHLSPANFWLGCLKGSFGFSYNILLSVSMKKSILDGSYQWDHESFSFCIWLISLGIVSCPDSPMLQHASVPHCFCGWVTFHGVYIPHYVCPSIYWWTLVSTFWFLWITLLRTLVCKCQPQFLVLLGT